MDKTVATELESLRKKVEPESGQAEFSGFSERAEMFVSPLLSPRHRQRSYTRAPWPSRVWHAVIREGFLGRILIYSAFHSSMGLCSVPGPVLNPGHIEWGPDQVPT